MDRIDRAIRGNELQGNEIFQVQEDDYYAADAARAPELMAIMNADQPTGGADVVYGPSGCNHVRFWKAKTPDQTSRANVPLTLFVHGGSWRSGTYLDSIGSAKVRHLLGKGYAFASVDYRLFPTVTVEEQVQDVADALSHLITHASELGIDPTGVVLMGHSSGAHVVALLGTDSSYLKNAGLNMSVLRGVICLDGSNYNAQAEIYDSQGPVADNMTAALGTETARLRNTSPTYHARGPNAKAFLLLHVERRGDIRQAVEFSAALDAAGTDASLHVFEGHGFEGHMQMLLKLGLHEYPATTVMDRWLAVHAPVRSL